MELKVQWFPGHMTKAKRMMAEQLKLVDAVVEMLDARVPRASTNPMLSAMLGNKPRVIAMSKIDMADPLRTKAWMDYFLTRGIRVVPIDASTGKGVKQLLASLAEVTKPVAEKWQKKGVKNRALRVMIVGVPNVGKSTLINRLAGKNRTVVADRPGVTRGQQWITIGRSLELLDTPGVLWPKFEDPGVGLALALTGAIKEEVFDREQAVVGLLEILKEYYPAQLGSKCHLTVTAQTPVEEILAAIGKARGCLKSGGVLDMDKVIQLVLRDFKAGRMGEFTLDAPPAVQG